MLAYYKSWMKIDHNIFDNETFQPKDEVEKDKLEFFWEKCLPEDETNVAASIRERTLRKIQSGTVSHISIDIKKKRRNRFYIAAASVAATVSILLSLPYIAEKLTQQEDIRQVVALMDALPIEETEDVVLVMSEQKKVQLASDAQITYTPEGNVSVDSEKLQFEKTEQDETKDAYHESYNQLLVPKGRRSQLLLSDGTKVWVNAGTKVIYPRVFGEKKREIYVEGEVYLEVTHDENRPFYVNTEGFEVKVLGTSFDVYAYKRMPESRVVLVNGSVEIKDQQNKQVRMAPNELVSLEHNNITEKRTVNASDYMAWTEGIMVLNGDHLNMLVDRLSLLYGTKIICDSSLDNEQIYGKLDLRDDLDEIIDYIKSMIPISAREENGVIYLKREK